MRNYCLIGKELIKPGDKVAFILLTNPGQFSSNKYDNIPRMVKTFPMSSENMILKTS